MIKKLFSACMIVTMLFSMITFSPMAAHATESYDGIINIVDGTGSGSGWSFSPGEVWINENGSYLVSGGGIQTENRIRVKTGVTASVTIDNVNISVNLPFEVSGTANVTLILKDNSNNILTSWGGHAGIRVQASATLTITTAGQALGNGILTATGSADSLSHWATAGIGGSELEFSGTIIIDGGTIIAQGGSGRGIYTGGAGIGGPAHMGCGDITINGGTITAIGGIVGIGGGSTDPERISGAITINGGTVKAFPGLIAGIGPGIGLCNTIAVSQSASVEVYSSGGYPAIDGTTPVSGHDAFLLSFMLDSAVSANTELIIENVNNEIDSLSLNLPNGYRNFAVSVSGTNTYKVAKSDGSAYLVLIEDNSDEFTGELIPPETVFNGLSVSLIDIPVCQINDTGYTSLTAALAAAVNEDTITLLRDIDYLGQITVTDKDLTFGLNSFTLNLINTTGTALEVGSGGKLSLTGEGALNAYGNSLYGYGVYAHNGGEASVTNAFTSGSSTSAAYAVNGGIIHVSGNATGTNTLLDTDTYCRGAQADGAGSAINVAGNVSSANNNGVVAQEKGIVFVGGDVSGLHTGAYADNGDIHIEGSATGSSKGAYAINCGVIFVGGDAVATANSGYGAFASDVDSSITVTGDAIAHGDYGNGAFSGNAAVVMIGGDAVSLGNDGYGAHASQNHAMVKISGHIMAENGTGAWARLTSSITVDGTITATDYIKIQDQIYGIADNMAITTKAGYRTYSDGTATVWIGWEQPAERLSGSNRYSTAANISQAGWDHSSLVLLARGDNYADALAGVPLAYLLDAPILLSSTSQIGATTLDEIERLGATRVIILGGTSAISDNVASILTGNGLTVERIAGSNRYHTAVLTAEYMRAHGASFDSAVIAVGTNFPDALAAASYAAIQERPILLTGSSTLSLITKGAIESMGIEDTFVVGGTSVISDGVLTELAQYGTAVRIAGSNRYSTAVEIAKYFDLSVDHYYIATGLNFPDAITGAVLAAKSGTGVLLVQGTLDIPNLVVREFVLDQQIKSVTLFGGTSVISEGIQNWFIDNL